MSFLKDSFIQMLKQNTAEVLCDNEIICSGISCRDCPFFSELNKASLIEELEVDNNPN